MAQTMGARAGWRSLDEHSHAANCHIKLCQTLAKPASELSPPSRQTVSGWRTSCVRGHLVGSGLGGEARLPVGQDRDEQNMRLMVRKPWYHITQKTGRAKVPAWCVLKLESLT